MQAVRGSPDLRLQSELCKQEVRSDLEDRPRRGLVHPWPLGREVLYTGWPCLVPPPPGPGCTRHLEPVHSSDSLREAELTVSLQSLRGAVWGPGRPELDARRRPDAASSRGLLCVSWCDCVCLTDPGGPGLSEAVGAAPALPLFPPSKAKAEG